MQNSNDAVYYSGNVLVYIELSSQITVTFIVNIILTVE